MVKREDSGKLVSDFERLLDSWVLSSAALEHWTLKQFLRSTLTDVKIKCEGKILECHKAILSARCVLILCNYWLIRLTLWECFQSIRSSVFRAMFQHDMRESKSNEIIIPDLDFNTVKDMVRYVYSGRWKMWEYFLLLNFLGCRVSDLPDKSDLLLSAADKYDIRWSWMVNVVPFSRIQFQSKTTIPNIPKKRGKDHLGNHLWPLLPIKAQFCFLCRDLKEECCQSLSANLAVDQVILFSCHDLGVQHKCDVKQMVFF